MELWMIIVIAAAAIVLLAIIIAILANVLRKYTISFKTGVVKYTTEVPVIKARKGAAIELPVLASRDYDLKGWYTDAQCTSPANFEKMPKGDMTLYAGWAKKQASKPAQKPQSAEPSLDLGGAIAHNLAFRIALDW